MVIVVPSPIICHIARMASRLCIVWGLVVIPGSLVTARPVPRAACPKVSSRDWKYRGAKRSILPKSVPNEVPAKVVSDHPVILLAISAMFLISPESNKS